jgi:hypothetical protein
MFFLNLIYKLNIIFLHNFSLKNRFNYYKNFFYFFCVLIALYKIIDQRKNYFKKNNITVLEQYTLDGYKFINHIINKYFDKKNILIHPTVIFDGVGNGVLSLVKGFRNIKIFEIDNFYIFINVDKIIKPLVINKSNDNSNYEMIYDASYNFIGLLVNDIDLSENIEITIIAKDEKKIILNDKSLKKCDSNLINKNSNNDQNCYLLYFYNTQGLIETLDAVSNLITIKSKSVLNFNLIGNKKKTLPYVIIEKNYTSENQYFAVSKKKYLELGEDLSSIKKYLINYK